MKLSRYNDFIVEKVNVSILDNACRLLKLYKKKIGDNYEDDRESLENKKTILNYRVDFAQKIKSISHFYNTSFSSIAVDKDRVIGPEFNEVQSLMNKSGYTIEIIGKLFDAEITDILDCGFQRFIRNYNLDDLSGSIDIYLFTLNEKLDLNAKVLLGGTSQSLNKLEVDSDDINLEYIIKYAYGYHKTPYGQLLLKQNGLTPEKFTISVFARIKGYLIDSLNLKYTLHQRKIYNFEFNIEDFITIDDASFIIHYSDLNDLFQSKSIVQSDKDENNITIKPIDEDFFKKEILSDLYQIASAFSVQDTGYDFIFTEKSN